MVAIILNANLFKNAQLSALIKRNKGIDCKIENTRKDCWVFYSGEVNTHTAPNSQVPKFLPTQPTPAGVGLQRGQWKKYDS